MSNLQNRELFPLKSEQAKPIDFKRVITKYLRFWYLFVIGVVISVVCAFFYIRYLTIPTYVVSTSLLIKDNESDTELSSAAAFSEIGLLQSSKNIDTEIEVLKSKSLMLRVVTELDLVTSYYIEGRVKDLEIYGEKSPVKVIISRLDSTAFGKQIALHINTSNSFQLEEENGKLTFHKFGNQIRKPYGTFTIVASPGNTFTDINTETKYIIKFHNLKDVAKQYNAALNVQPIKEGSNVISLSLTTPIKDKGVDILNKLVEVYNKEASEDRNTIASNTVEFIDERLKYLSTELSGVEKDVEEYKSLNEVTDVTTQASNYLEQASDYKKQLAEWATQIEVLESIQSYLNQNKSDYKMVPSALGIQDPTLLGLITKFNELQLERERMLLTIQPNNPLIKNINEQLENLKGNILENLSNIKNGLKITSNNLRSSSGHFQSQIRKVPVMERELLEINRQQAIKQNLYLYLLQKREESALSLAATVPTSRVIDSAAGGDFPISPKKTTIYLISFLLGIGIPFAILYLIELLNDKVETQNDVEIVTSAPILGELAHNPVKETVVVTKTNRSPIVEMFRLIRANLYFAAVNKENKVLLITSSMSGEGKTFFSINLGASLVLTGKKVVVIELDLRKPRLTKDLGMTEGIGITNYLISNKISIDEIIRPSEKVPGLFVIGSGPVPPNPSEIMLNPKLGHLIDTLRENFDHIILDTAPIGQVADAFNLSNLIDSTIYLVRYNYTLKKQIEIIENIYKNKTLKHPMIVLNDAKKINGFKYGYGYGYGYGDDKQSKKKSRVLS